MKRWVIDRHGRDSLRIDEAQNPDPAAGEVLVRVCAVALNARDPMMIDHGMGLTLDFPFVPASDMAGVVEATGSEVTRFAPGDRVISNFLPEWIDGQPGGSAREPSYRTLGGHFQAYWRNASASRKAGSPPHRRCWTTRKPARCRSPG